MTLLKVSGIINASFYQLRNEGHKEAIKRVGSTMMGRPRLKMNIEEFEKMYRDGIPVSIIAAHFNISISSIRILRLKLNIPLRKRVVKNTYVKDAFMSGQVDSQEIQ